MDGNRIAVTSSNPRLNSPISSRNFASSRSTTLRAIDDWRRTQRVNDARVQRFDSAAFAASDRNSDRFDRDRYVRRNEHHSRDWYRNNGWTYDTGYWQRYHRHRYYNDSLGLVIFDATAPYTYSYPYDTYSYPYVYPSEEYIEPQVTYYDSSADLNTLLAVQEELAREGYYHGAIDGIIGPGTLSAIIAYQEDFGLPVTGRIDTPLLQSMQLIQ